MGNREHRDPQDRTIGTSANGKVGEKLVECTGNESSATLAHWPGIRKARANARLAWAKNGWMGPHERSAIKL